MICGKVDVVIIVVDPTFESFEIAARVTDLGRSMSVAHTLAILNGIDSEETESIMKRGLEMRKVNVLGCVKYDPEIRKAGRRGDRDLPLQSDR